MNEIIVSVVIALPLLAIVLGAAMLDWIIESIKRIVSKKTVSKNDFGYIEIEPDPFGNKGLVTTIHWGR